MSLKKKILLVSSLALLTLPVISFADLVTVNNTNEYSAVRVTSTGICSGNVGRYTAPHSTSTTSPLAVRVLCSGSGPSCAAVMYSSTTCVAGTEVANVSVNMANMNVSVNGVINPRYSIIAQGSTMTINYAG